MDFHVADLSKCKIKINDFTNRGALRGKLKK